MGRPLLRLTLEAFSREWTEEEMKEKRDVFFWHETLGEKYSVDAKNTFKLFFIRPKHGLRLTVCLKRGF